MADFEDDVKVSSKPAKPKTNVLDSWDNYDTFKTNLKKAFQEAGVDVSQHDDEAIVSAFYKNLPPEKKQKFDTRYKLDRPFSQTETADEFLSDATAGIKAPLQSEAMPSTVGRKIKDGQMLPKAGVGDFLKTMAKPVSDFATTAGKTIADTTGLSKIPRTLRDPAANVVGTVPGLGPAARIAMAPEMVGEETTANLSPLAIASTTTGMGRLAAPGARALSTADRLFSGAGVAEGLTSAAGGGNRAEIMQGLSRAAFNAPGMLPQRPGPPKLPDDPNSYFKGPLEIPERELMGADMMLGPGPGRMPPPVPFRPDPANVQAANEFFPGPRPPQVDPTDYFGGNRLELPPPQAIHGPEAQLPLPGFQPRYQTTGAPELPPAATRQTPQGQQSLFPYEDYPRPIGPRAREPAFGEVLGPQGPAQPPLFDELQLQPQQMSGDIPTPFQPPRPGLGEQPALFPNAPLPNFGGRNWKFHDTGEQVHPPFGPQPPKSQAPGAGAARNKVTLRNMESGQATTQLMLDFAGGAVGGAIGGAADEDNPLLGALAGAAVGAGAGHALGAKLGAKGKVAQQAVMGAMLQEKDIAKVHREAMHKAKDPIMREQVKQAYLSGLPNDPLVRKRASAYLDSPQGAGDYLRLFNAFGKGNLLSSPTALVTQLFNFPSLAIRNVAIDPMRAGISKVLGNKTDSGLAFYNSAGKGFGEVSPYYSAAYAGSVKGLKDAWRVLRTGQSDEAAESLMGDAPGATKSKVSFDFPHSEIHEMDVNPVLKAAGWAPDMVHRIVNALDVFPRAIARAQSETMLGVTAALAEGEKLGLKGKALNGYVAKNFGKQTLSQDAKNEAGRRALETVLQEDPDSLTNMVIRAKMHVPILDTALPFVKSLSNAFRQQLEVMPGVGAAVMKARYPDMPEAIRTEMWAKQTFGLMALAGIAGAEFSGRIEFTGAEPIGTGAKMKEKAYQQPYSIVLKDDEGKPLGSISYVKMPLIGGLIASYMAAKDGVKSMEEGMDPALATMSAGMDIGKYAVDKSSMGLLEDLINTLQGFAEAPSKGSALKQMANYTARQITGMAFPMSGLVRSVTEKGFDNKIRKQEDPMEVGMGGVFRSQLPWDPSRPMENNFKKREPVLRWDGSYVTRPGGPARRMLDPLETFENPGGVQQEIADAAGNDAIPGALDVQKGFVIGEGKNKQKVAISRKEDFVRRREVGQKRSELISKLLKTKEFNAADKEERKEMIRKTSTEANKEVNEAFKKKLKNR
jgi:hypothetical protein